MRLGAGSGRWLLLFPGFAVVAIRVRALHAVLERRKEKRAANSH